MSPQSDQALVRELVSGNRYLSLATCDGSTPWVAPIEYLCDAGLNLYFLSTVDSLHARHIEANPLVAVAVFETVQPDYAPGLTATLRGVQIEARAERLPPSAHPEAVRAAIAALKPPMPPYAVFRISPVAFYLPRIIDGVNQRVRVSIA